MQVLNGRRKDLLMRKNMVEKLEARRRRLDSLNRLYVMPINIYAPPMLSS